MKKVKDKKFLKRTGWRMLFVLTIAASVAIFMQAIEARPALHAFKEAEGVISFNYLSNPEAVLLYHTYMSNQFLGIFLFTGSWFFLFRSYKEEYH